MGHRLQLSVGVAAQLVLIERHAKAGPGRRVDAEIREAQRPSTNSSIRLAAKISAS
jgi:hypothetical protein